MGDRCGLILFIYTGDNNYARTRAKKGLACTNLKQLFRNNESYISHIRYSSLKAEAFSNEKFILVVV